MIDVKYTTRKSQVEIVKGEFAGNKGVVVGLREPNINGGYNFYLVNIGTAPDVQFVQVTCNEFILIKI